MPARRSATASAIRFIDTLGLPLALAVLQDRDGLALARAGAGGTFPGSTICSPTVRRP